MRSTTLAQTGAAVATLVLAVALSACTDKHSDSATTSSSTSTSSTRAPSASPSTSSRSELTPRNVDGADGPNETIASYIKSAGIQEISVKPGEDGAPIIDLPTPEGWADAGAQTPDYAAGAIVYTGPEAQGADYTPNVVAILSELRGDVDPHKLIDLAGGEMKNLPGFEQFGPGETDVLSGYPAYKIAGMYDLQNVTAVTAQMTVVIPGPHSVYVLQFNATSNQDQAAALGAAADFIDANTKISF